MSTEKKILTRADLDSWAVEAHGSGRPYNKILVSREEMVALRDSLGVLRSAANSDRFTVLTVGGVVTVELEPDFTPEEVLLAKTGVKSYVAFGLFVAAMLAVVTGVVATAYQVQQKVEAVFGAVQ